MPSRQLPHYWTPEQVRRILAAMLAGQPWLLALLMWYPALRQAKAGRGGLVPPHPELVDAFRLVSRGRPDDRVFQLSARTAAGWIAQGIAKAGLVAGATGTGVKGPGSHSCVRHWLQSSLNVNALSAWLGHSSPTVTLNTYLVLAPDTLCAISEVL